jgi:GT2 family glycosyltransferase
MMNTVILSVIIPTYHRNDLLAKCLDCLAPGVQTLASEHYEVIVTDDGRETTAEQMILDRYPWVKWVAGSSKGPAANRNNGASYAHGEWLIFTDDDCLPDAQWLEAYSQAIALYDNYSVFEGRVYVDRPRKTLAEQSPVNESGGYLWSCNLAIRSKVLKLLTGFDERFPYAAMEDVDFRLRLTRAGYHYHFVPTASICHPFRPSGGWLEINRHQDSVLIYLSLHPEEFNKINSIYYLKYTLRQLVKSTIPGTFKFKGQGFKQALIEHLAFLQMAWILFVNSNRKKSY